MRVLGGKNLDFHELFEHSVKCRGVPNRQRRGCHDIALMRKVIAKDLSNREWRAINPTSVERRRAWRAQALPAQARSQ